MAGFPNFLQAESKGFGGPDLLSSLMQGYQMSKVPEQMERDKTKQQQLIEKLMLGNEKAKMENQYQEPQIQQDMQQKEQLIQQLLLGNQNQSMANQFQPQMLEQALMESQLGNQQRQFQVGHQEEDYERQKMIDALNQAVLHGKLGLQEARQLAALATAQQKQNAPAPLTEQQKAYEKAIGTSNAKFYTENVEGLQTSKQMQSNIDELKKLTKRDSFSNAVGPLDKYTTAISTKATRRLAGEIETITGKLLSDYAKQFPGTKSDYEMKLYQQFIPTRGDSEAEFKGKITMLDNLNKKTSQRGSLVAKLMREGVPQDEAVAMSFEKVPELNEQKLAQQGEGGALSGVINGKQVKVRPEHRERFLRSGGVLE